MNPTMTPTMADVLRIKQTLLSYPEIGVLVREGQYVYYAHLPITEEYQEIVYGDSIYVEHSDPLVVAAFLPRR